MRRLAGSVIAAIALLLPDTLPAQLSRYPGEAALRSRYQVAHSRFVTLGGTPVHYVDEGHGAAIVLMHGSYASLRQWSGWARVLSRHYRVIRFDMPPGGLSGPSPDGRYDLTARLAIIEGLTKSLNVGRFVLVATSSAGLTAAAYAADHPDRIQGLILNNIATSFPVADRSALPPALRQAIERDKALNGYHSTAFWREVLLGNVVAKRKVTSRLVREWTDLNNRYPAMPRAAQPPTPDATFAQTPGDLARIDAPTLLIWSADDTETTLARHGQSAFSALKTADKKLVVIPRCGHMMPTDCGDAALRPTLDFLKRIAGAIAS